MTLLEEEFHLLRDLVYEGTGLMFDDRKLAYMESRVAKRMPAVNCANVRDYFRHLRYRDPGRSELQALTELLTTNETYFFRDPAQYEAIRSVLLPRLMEERQQTKKLRFWSAAASTGQEAYSLAMLLIAQGLSDWDVRILGTDFSSQVLERARSGKYQQIEVNRGLPASLLVKHFRQSGTEWQLSEPVRRMVSFETIDLRNSMHGLGPFDLVFCRNVMIYFDAGTKKSILEELHRTMFGGAWLLLGGVETAFGVDEWFERQTVQNATVYVAR